MMLIAPSRKHPTFIFGSIDSGELHDIRHAKRPQLANRIGATACGADAINRTPPLQGRRSFARAEMRPARSLPRLQQLGVANVLQVVDHELAFLEGEVFDVAWLVGERITVGLGSANSNSRAIAFGVISRPPAISTAAPIISCTSPWACGVVGSRVAM